MLQVRSHCTIDPLVDAQALTGVEDVRLYINGVNHSAAFVAEIQGFLSDLPSDYLRAQYRSAAESWITYLETFGTMPNAVERTRNDLDQALDTADLVTLFQGLGSRQAGWSGGIHPFNFIYRQIIIPPVSLVSVINRHKRTTGGSEISELKDVWPVTLVFSQGPAPSFEPFDPAVQISLGRLEYLLEFQYVNPVAELLRNMTKELEKMGRRIERQRVRYLEPIANHIGELDEEQKLRLSSGMQALEDLKTAFDELSGDPDED